MPTDFLGYGCGIFMDLPGDLGERVTVVEAFFDLDPIGQTEMFLITFSFTHDTFLSAQDRRSVTHAV